MVELIAGIIAAIGVAFAIQPAGSIASSMMSAEASRKYAEAEMKRRKAMYAKGGSHGNG